MHRYLETETYRNVSDLIDIIQSLRSFFFPLKNYIDVRNFYLTLITDRRTNGTIYSSSYIGLCLGSRVQENNHFVAATLPCPLLITVKLDLYC